MASEVPDVGLDYRVNVGDGEKDTIVRGSGAKIMASSRSSLGEIGYT